MRLLVALDMREGSADALELARVLVTGGGGSVLVVAVLPIGPLPTEYALLSGEEEAETELGFALARDRLAGLEVETRTYGGGSPAAILSKLAEVQQFDAIIVGSPHRGVLGRVLVGSVASSLLNGATADVAVAPKGYGRRTHEPLRAVAVGIDGSDEAMAALARAEKIVARVDATMKLVLVNQLEATEGSPDKAEKILREASDSLDPRTRWSTAMPAGRPAAELVQLCDENDEIGLLVLGSRHYGPVARVLLGSVSRKVVQKAGCPVMVARRP